MANKIMRHSWNINGQDVENWVQLLEWGKRERPVWTLIMDNQDKARQWKDTVGGEVTYRSWDQHESDYYKRIAGKDAARQMVAENQKVKDCWQCYKMNEPDQFDWARLQAWIIEFATEAKKHGFKSTAHGLAIMKNWPQPEWVEAGACDDLIKYAYENQDTFILNVHEYTTGFAWSDHTPDYPANLFDLEASRAGEQSASINWTEYRPANGMVNWFLGRVAWVTNIRAKKVVGDVIPFVIDEAIFDWHAAVHSQMVALPDGRTVRVSDELRARYGDDRYNRDIRGVLGSRRLLEWLETGVTNQPISDERFADVVLRNFDVVEKLYPANCKAIKYFTMNGKWRFPEGHDYIPIANALLPKMTRERLGTVIGTTPDEDPPVVIPPVLTPDPATVTLRPTRIKGLTNGVNVRSKPTVKATVISNTALDEWVTVPMSESHWQADMYNWRFVILPDGKQGFVASAVIGIELPVIDFTDAERALIAAWRDNDWDSVLSIFANPRLYNLSIAESNVIEAHRENTQPYDAIRLLLDLLEDVEQGD
jgi:hypothetical protein